MRKPRCSLGDAWQGGRVWDAGEVWGGPVPSPCPFQSTPQRGQPVQKPQGHRPITVPCKARHTPPSGPLHCYPSAWNAPAQTPRWLPTFFRCLLKCGLNRHTPLSTLTRSHFLLGLISWGRRMPLDIYLVIFLSVSSREHVSCIKAGVFIFIRHTVGAKYTFVYLVNE